MCESVVRHSAVNVIELLEKDDLSSFSDGQRTTWEYFIPLRGKPKALDRKILFDFRKKVNSVDFLIEKQGLECILFLIEEKLSESDFCENAARSSCESAIRQSADNIIRHQRNIYFELIHELRNKDLGILNFL